MAFAFVFPGQGSQSVGMMTAYGDAAVVRATFDEASTTLGQDLWELLSQGTGRSAGANGQHPARDVDGRHSDLSFMARQRRQASGGRGWA
jgi:malonyl CoA-acyl carrier protein transacylase